MFFENTHIETQYVGSLKPPELWNATIFRNEVLKEVVRGQSHMVGPNSI